MAKKVNHSAAVHNVAPGADPYAKNKAIGRRIGNMLGCACLLVFIVFDELWIGTLACALGFAVIFGIQVFYDRSVKWYASPNLYAALGCIALAYVEYAYNFLSNLMKFR